MSGGIITNRQGIQTRECLADRAHNDSPWSGLPLGSPLFYGVHLPVEGEAFESLGSAVNEESAGLNFRGEESLIYDTPQAPASSFAALGLGLVSWIAQIGASRSTWETVEFVA